MTYVLYQHWGNLSPDALEEEEIYQRVRDAGDGGKLLRDYAYKCDREVEGARWSYCRDIGCTRVVMIDSRAGRVLDARRAQHGRRRRVGLDHRARHRRLRPPADRHVAAAVPRPRAALPRGVERGGVPTAPGAASPRGLGRSSGRAPTSSTGPRSASRSTSCAACWRRSAPAGAASRRARLLCFQVMFIMRTSPRSRFRAAAACARGSGRRRARRSGTRSARASSRGVMVGFSRAGERIGRVLARSAGVPAPPVRWRLPRRRPAI